jgi:hypothetical protein
MIIEPLAQGFSACILQENISAVRIALFCIIIALLHHHLVTNQGKNSNYFRIIYYICRIMINLGYQ